ncbi:MAG: DUF6683 family protein [Sphingorhabdus sp.]
MEYKWIDDFGRTQMIRSIAVAFAILWCSTPSSLGAQIDSSLDGPIMSHANFYSNFFHQRFLDRLVDPIKIKRSKTGVAPKQPVAQPRQPRDKPQPKSDTPLLANGGKHGLTPQKMATLSPEPQRAEITRVFNALLAKYPEFEKASGIPPNDMGGALATFIGGNWMIYNNKELPDAHFAALVKQMREAVSKDEALRAESVQIRREAYEQLAILGLYMALSKRALDRQPDTQVAATLRANAGRYLQDLLKVDPATIQIGVDGVSI